MWAYPFKQLFGENTTKEDFTKTVFPRLYTERHISPADHRFWAQFTTLFDSAEDVFATLTLADLRRVATDAPENIVTLVEVLTMHLESLVNDPNFAPVPPLHPGGWGALFASTAPPPRVDERDRQKEALNCCRVLTRVVPILYESEVCEREDTDIRDLEWSTLWAANQRHTLLSNSIKKGLVRSDTRSSEGDKSLDEQYILTDGTETSIDPLQGGTDDLDTQAQEPPSIGFVLLMTLMELLFYSGFTMPWTEEQFVSTSSSEISRVHFTIWEAGIGSPLDLRDVTAEHINRRMEVMELLLVLFSKPMYVEPKNLAKAEMHALNFITMELDRPVVLSFLCSLLNTASNNQPSESWIPLMGQHHRESYLSLCLQILAALLLHEVPPDASLFLFYAKKLYREADFLFLMNGFARYFKVTMDTSHGPFETRNVKSTFAKPAEEHVSEVLAILWVMVRQNDAFRHYVTESAYWSIRLMSWLLHVALSNKAHLATLGQAQLALFLLQDLSAEPRFGMNLSVPGSMEHVTLSLRLVRRSGTVALDVLVEGIYFMFFTSSGRLAPVYPTMLLILYNTAPYWKHVSVVSASRLERMLDQLSSPKFLLSHPAHPDLLSLLLGTLSRVVQAHPGENVHLIYMLVQSAGLVERTRHFCFKDALAYIYEAWEHAKRQGAVPKRLPDTPPAPPTPAKHSALPDPMAELEQSQDTTAPPLDDQQAVPTEDAEEPENPATESRHKETSPQMSDNAEEVPNTSPSSRESPDTMAPPSKGTDDAPTQSSDQLDWVAARIGKEGFVPTEEWTESWVHTLDFTVLTPMLAHLVPRVNEFCANTNVSQSPSAHEQVLSFLREELQAEWQFPTVPADPVPFQWSEESHIWLQSYVWGLVFSIGLIPLGIWLDTRTTLFQVHMTTLPAATGTGAMEVLSALTTSILPQRLFDVPVVEKAHGAT
ncbi:hypothetical protein MNAN1_001513 [Malassezia nana]|uniref:Protein HID1 n=1 Tax=Malassezia nana TaxID=180528 RepID=A0AAF0J704_9BASI|nr:hypothetical protein MNAN1_001513 [Malassezia nana]